ncbi:GCN5 family acetyltransferase [Pantoea sp. BL1]|uniref:GNAT family N-acetyltransferase n=1 Tax=unclassified Pantoea TaxID=2630326 RepID=UPI0005F7B6B4|nr:MULTISPECIES: GNAT family N-acetyltransferase [unclassified Pantoea]KJV25487.1 GCN5 family acetyltransferase [Pantoea sp. SM3]KJV47244.1 GCN5 family acetyltransferase [Pantoea sp. BL1]
MLIRKLSPSEWNEAYPLISQLRDISLGQFRESVKIQSLSGYELIGAFIDDRLTGLMGWRPVHTLARGYHLHIDDLVVDEHARGSGIGKALLDFATRESAGREMNFIFLDARKEAIPFYENNNFILHASPSMKKPLK